MALGATRMVKVTHYVLQEEKACPACGVHLGAFRRVAIVVVVVKTKPTGGVTPRSMANGGVRRRFLHHSRKQ
ncbi:MAG TPA: hypothetical protein VNN62_22755 [Methylomirabilota bacterium]|jgi:hypothetical protein|nr:hypothetical protein [Methylomirabilota bacterium]